MAARWICARGVQPVRVVHGDGQVISLLPPVKVADILVNHPHHYICHMCPELPTSKSSMLSLDHDLEPGYLYFLLPLPRLFPTSSAGPPSCCCRTSNQDTSIEEGHTTPRRYFNDNKFGFPSPLIFQGVQRMMDRIGSPIRTAKKVSPELSRSPTFVAKDTRSPLLSPTYGSTKSCKRSGGIGAFSNSCRSPRSSPNRSRSTSPKAFSKGSMRDNGRCFMEDLCSMKWKPRLGCISETDALVTACEELRLCLDRRRLTFDSRLPRSPSSSRLLSREWVLRSLKEDGNSKKPVKYMVDDGYSNKPRRQVVDDGNSSNLAKLILDDGYNNKPMGHMSLGSFLFV